MLIILAAAAAGGALLFAGWQSRAVDPVAWSEAEIALLQSLSLDSLPPLPGDPTNAVAGVPLATDFGAQLFLDPRLSGNGSVSCATCHQPGRHFTDGLPRGQAFGTSGRNTPSIVGSAYSPWLYWDGRRDSQWSQALAPIEDPNEHATNRLQVVRLIASADAYRDQYETLFGPLPDIDDRTRFPELHGAAEGQAWETAWASMAVDDRIAVSRAFSNIGKAIAAFERTLMPSATRFDHYVAAVVGGALQDGEPILSDDEIRGLRLFIGPARCTECHNGPLLTNNEFHNTGVLSAPGQLPDKGRVAGVREVLENPFNCRGNYSDDPRRRCQELDFVRTGPELTGAFRTPSLRNVAETAPYMHQGQVATLEDVLLHYNDAPEAMIGHNEAKPLDLSERQLRQLEAFLGTLSSLAAAGQSESM